MEKIYESRPFKTRNADEFDLSQVLTLFVNPLEGVTSPFDFENSIIKGRMGSGKTMYLRANYAYYLYSLVPNILDENKLILPIFIRLSDFQHISEPSEIYKAIIVKMVEEIASIYLRLDDANHLAKIHSSIQAMPTNIFKETKFSTTIKQLIKLGADEYTERIKTELGFQGGVQPKFIKLLGEFKQEKIVEIKNKPNPGIKDIEESYKNLLEPFDGKILLLIDEAGSLDKSFFRGKEQSSFFEILMNQLRTASYIRTKIAIYPNSYQDILTETRYGDTLTLEEHIFTDEGYKSFRKRTLHLIENYLRTDGITEIHPADLFKISSKGDFGDCIEQLINASNGNMRRLIQLLDDTMEVAYLSHKGKDKINKLHVFDSLKSHSNENEYYYSEDEREFLYNLIRACKSRSTFKFQFPYMSPVLNKYTSRSQEHNLINITEVGAGRKSSTYAFDYSFCVAHDIPTHYQKGSAKIYGKRTLKGGRWINRVAKINESILEHASITNKIEGVIEYLVKSSSGFIHGDDNMQYFFQSSYIIEEDQNKKLSEGRRVRFFSLKIGAVLSAQAIEIL